MRKYDLIVVGSGSGMNIVEEALHHGMKVGLVECGPLGGTCPNLGCIPSKTLILAADRVMEITEARKLGIAADITRIDFTAIMERTRNAIAERQEEMKFGLAHTKGLTLYEGVAHFTDNYTIAVNGQEMTAPKIVIASGSRPTAAPLHGLDKVDYLNNESLLQLRTRPDSLIIVGGGYIGVEYAHFFAAMGTKVTVIEMADRLVPAEEREISRLLRDELSTRMDVYTGVIVDEVRKTEGGISVAIHEKDGKKHEIAAAQLMMATGRRSNADLLNVEKTGVELDERGFIKVDEYMETTKKNIYAIGDVNGKHMFTHTANREALVAGNNVVHKDSTKMDFHTAPHAVFTHPQIAGVGLTEEQARKDHNVEIGFTRYLETAYGEATMEDKGFAKAVIEKETGKILGFHIIGPHASILIQEAVNAMAANGQVQEINVGIHIHPALSELVQRTVNSILEDDEPEP